MSSLKQPLHHVEKKPISNISSVRTNEKKRRAIFKPSFDSPYTLKWPSISNAQQKELFAYLLKFFFTDLPARVSRIHSEENEGNAERDLTKKKTVGIPDDIVCGINHVTRLLEKGEVRLVIIFKPAQPSMLVHHLLILSRMKHVLICPLSEVDPVGFGELLRKFKVKSLLCLGVKKNTPLLDALVDFFGQKIPLQSTPWLEDIPLQMKTSLHSLHVRHVQASNAGSKKNTRKNSKS